MSLLLSIDTAGKVCAAAISESGDIRASRLLDEPRVHAARLTPLIQDLVKNEGLRMSDLDAVAVSKGPGSYTGLRIGVSTAKGVCFGLGVPLVGIETFHALATANVNQFSPVGKGTLVTIAPSRRGEAYWQVWAHDPAQPEIPKAVTEPRSDRFDALVAEILTDYQESSSVSIVGDVPDELSADLGRSSMDIRVVDTVGTQPTIEGVVTLGTRAVERSEFVDVADFEPFYLKAFVAKKGGSPFDRLPKSS